MFFCKCQQYFNYDDTAPTNLTVWPEVSGLLSSQLKAVLHYNMAALQWQWMAPRWTELALKLKGFDASVLQISSTVNYISCKWTRKSCNSPSWNNNFHKYQNSELSALAMLLCCLKKMLVGSLGVVLSENFKLELANLNRLKSDL